jgi:hypothetical protein
MFEERIAEYKKIHEVRVGYWKNWTYENYFMDYWTYKIL